MMDSFFVTVLMTYGATEKAVPGPMGPVEEERFGWTVKINGLVYKPLSKEQIIDLQTDFKDFVLKDDELELTCFEDNNLSYDTHDQFHPPMKVVTKILDKITRRGYRNTSCSLTAEKNEVTYGLWNFERRIDL